MQQRQQLCFPGFLYLKLLAAANALLALSVTLSALTTVGAFDVIYGIVTKTLWFKVIIYSATQHRK